ncbi:MAG: long-chain-fatty-acid--CoA ligase [Rhizobiales bacterium TMED83]|nr:long-chain fatty acid--CoA ligase [Rhodobiaceae bacterium]RPF92068.1 MAG: long-chain-fatty-acid--CoA ligase [Rhizobiales bacterium TMED83]
MFGAMQDVPLLVNRILDHAIVNHPEREIVSRLVEGNIHRETYADAHLRARKLSQALQALGFGQGDVLATLAWNTHRHFEAWYGITGIGGVYHTLNPRLFADQLSYIINHAGDKVIFTDLTFVPILEGIEKDIPDVKGFIIMTDAAHMPETTLSNVHCYEDLIDGKSGDFNWVEVDERAPCGMCYTSGTTGNPKGVCYTHRSNVLHTLVGNSSDVMGLRSVDSLMPVVPLFHANAWGLAFGAPAVGAKIVNPGPNMDGESIYELLTDEAVSFTAAVPTVWLMLMQHLETNKLDLPALETVVIGGSAVPRVMLEKFERDYNVSVKHAWGMTELSPLGTIASFKAGMENMSFDEQMDIKVKQGRPPYLVEMKITDDDGNELPRDGKAFGHLMVRGPFIVGEYIKGDGGQILDEDGFFDTGDVATIDPLGFMQITDRSKDVIKSGGEWISSIEIENIAVGHEHVQEAAVIGIAHPKWDERPLLVIVKNEGAEVAKEEILGYLEGKIAKWWMPDDVVFVDEIPHTATGKIQKLTLRQQFEDYQLPTAEAVAE